MPANHYRARPRTATAPRKTPVCQESLVRDRRLAQRVEDNPDACGLDLAGWQALLENLECAAQLGYHEAVPATRRGSVAALVGPEGAQTPFTFDPSRPTHTRPGSPERQAVLAERRRRKIPLFLDGDCAEEPHRAAA